MTVKCCILKCGKRHDDPLPNGTNEAFGRYVKTRRIPVKFRISWAPVIRPDDPTFVITDRHRICAHHLPVSDYLDITCRSLMPDVVPSRFLDGVHEFAEVEIEVEVEAELDLENEVNDFVNQFGGQSPGIQASNVPVNVPDQSTPRMQRTPFAQVQTPTAQDSPLLQRLLSNNAKLIKTMEKAVSSVKKAEEKRASKVPKQEKQSIKRELFKSISEDPEVNNNSRYKINNTNLKYA